VRVAAASRTVTGGAVTAAPGVHAHRVIFIDLARAMAVVMMVYGHTVDALLAEPYRVGRLYDIWQFQRGLTSCFFLLLSGFAFSIATSRHWHAHLQFSAALVKRMRRFALFILLGYALHFPVRHFSELPSASADLWRFFYSVDVLQLIGVAFIGVQLLVIVTRTRLRFTIAAFALATLLVVTAPAVWSIDWSAVLPLWLSSYLSPSTGSAFPIVPWAAYVLIGAGTGQLYSRWGASHLGAFANRVLLAPGAVLIAAWFVVDALAVALFGAGPWSWVPALFLLRVGTCMVVLSVLAHGSRSIARMPHVFGALAQESLLVYFVHLCIVFGSIWNYGLAHWYGRALTPGQTFGATVAILAAMTLLAWEWNRWKHVRPRAARWVSMAVGAGLIGALI
jgi:uncharacterized membrane protein